MESKSTQDENLRVIVYISLDSFECQAWIRDYPQLEGYPCIVTNKSGRITSVSFEAKSYGITENMKLIDARRLCRSLQIFETPNVRGKPDTSRIRHASWEVIDSVKDFCETHSPGVIIEYAALDELYLDITKEVTQRVMYKNPIEIQSLQYPFVMDGNVYLEGRSQTISHESLEYRVKNMYPKSYIKSHSLRDEERMFHGSMFTEELLAHLFSHTCFRASAGIGTNKLMAKLAASLNKPSSITILPHTALTRVGYMIDLKSIPGLSGARGEQVKKTFGIDTMGELAELSKESLESYLQPELAHKVYCWSRGWSDAPVVPKLMMEEVSCGKTFPNYVGAVGIRNEADLHYYIHNLSEEMMERIREEKHRHNRQVDFLKIIFQYWDKITNATPTISCTFPITAEDTSDSISWRAVEEMLAVPFDFATMQLKSLTLSGKPFVPEEESKLY